MKDGKTVLVEVGIGPVPMSFLALHWDNPNVECIGFEPHPEYFAAIKAAAGDRPNVHLHNVAIGDEPGKMQLSLEGTSSALVGVASPFAQHHGAAREFKTHEVEVRRISDFDTGQIDHLRIDVEGAEWSCLKHLVSRPQQLVIEMYNNLATYINPHLFEICEWAQANGYQIVSIRDGDFTFQR